MILITNTNSNILNFIRFLCSQGVVLGHMMHFYAKQNVFLNGIASYCVLLFFILSGFLISYSLSSNLNKNPNYNFKSFFMDRFFRIYPPFVGALILVILLDVAGYLITNQGFSWFEYVKNFSINLFQLQEYPLANILNKSYKINFFYFPYLGTNLPLWTISIEWWLYMFYGFIVFYIVKNKTVGLKEIIILIILSVSPVYYLLVSTHMEKGLTIFWFLGVLITPSLMMSNNRVIFNKLSFTFLLLLLLGGMVGFVFLGYNTGALIFLLALFLLVVYQKEENIFINKLSKLSEKLASYSYSLYLTHYSILFFLFKVFKIEFSLINFIFLLLLVNLTAYFFAQIFEVKSKKLKYIYENYRSHRD